MMNSEQLAWLDYLIRKRAKEKEPKKLTKSSGIYLNRYGKWIR